MNCLKLEENIYYYTDIFNDPQDFVDEIDNSSLEWKDWFSSDGSVLYGLKAGGPVALPNNILDSIKYIANYCFQDYSSKTGIKAGWIPEYYTVQKYYHGSYMGPHVDSTDKTENKFPTLSMVIYFNDNYEGGNIAFPNQSIDIKPKAGSVLVFPSYEPYIHDPKAVTNGTKYMSPVFCFKEPF
jgi:hypothetical protein